MGYQSGRFGIEYRPEGPEEETPWLLWAVGVAVLVALAYGSIAAYRKIVVWATSKDDPPVVQQVPKKSAPEVAEPEISAPKIVVTGERPRKVNNLLMRYDRARATGNIAMQVATIEEIRSFPGAPMADMDDELARRLGPLKLHMLFGAGMRNEWVKTIEVKRGNSASRIAAEYGTTVKCLEKLNGDVSSLKVGRQLKVMNHPQFRLSVYRKTCIADLSLDGRFFKRYDLTAAVSCRNGSYVFPSKTRQFLADNGIRFSGNDLAELEMLLPKGASLVIADFR